MNKDQMLAHYVERWFKQGSRRSIQMLARLTSVPYPTIRRMAQKESTPSLETAMAVLNVVATIPETLAYFSDNEGVNRFFKRFSEYTRVSDQDFKSHIQDRESFWVLMLGLTIGASHPLVKDLLGSFGLATLGRLIEKGVLVETSPGVFTPQAHESFMYMEGKKLAADAIGYITEMPAEDPPFQRFLVCNVTEEGFDAMRLVQKKAFDDCQSIAAQHAGKELVAFTFVGKSILMKTQA